MSQYFWQRGLRRSRRANRVGITLLVMLLLVLLASVVQGVRTLAA